MAETGHQETTTSKTSDLEDAKLLGFEFLESEGVEAAHAEQAVGAAFNKRGGEGPPV
jgi:hypothetical protein